jgi:hypothetical protein
VLVATYVPNDRSSLKTSHGWLLMAVLSAAFMLSRGIAKSGAREPYTQEYDR